jgi:RNA polymerase sigma-70 factor (ECF subfamily)
LPEDDEQPLLELIDQAQREDDPNAAAAAFAALVRRFERTALAVAYAVVGNAATAGDVTQDAFIKAWQRIGELKEPRRFAAWLSRIVRNTAHDHLRRRPRHEVSVDQQPASGADDRLVVVDPLTQMDRREVRRGIEAALAELDELTRSAVMLRYYHGMASRQIGELLNLSPAAVDMRLSRARTQLREKLAALAPARC